jgi:ferredoxin
VHFPGGTQNKRFTIARGVREAGAMVSLPRLKTHALTGMTGALKNTFGVVPGSLKAGFHIRHPDVEGFSRMIADLNALVPSQLFVMDAIMGMEGNGPGSGDLVPVGILLFSDDPVAIDSVACRIMGIDPLSVAVIRIAQEMGLGNANPAAIDLRGDDLRTLMPPAFKLPARSPTEGIPRWVMRLAKDLIVPKPVIASSLCTKCGECVASCPTDPKSLRQTRGSVPVYDYGSCIRCYCCQETCRHGAISLRTAPLSRFFESRRKAPTA